MTLPGNPFELLSQGKPITKPLLVGGTFATAWVTLPSMFFLAALGLAGLGALRREWPLVAIALSVAPVPGSFAIVAALVQLARRRWLEVTLDGFVLTKRDGSRQKYQEEQIVAIAQQSIPMSSGGFKRRVILELQQGERQERLECFYALDPGTADPLYALLQRVQRTLMQRLQAGLPHGERLTGDGWYYDRQGLHIQRGPALGVYPVEQLTYLAWFDEQIKIYRQQEWQPFFTIAQGSRNAEVLGQLLWSQIGARPTVNDPIASHPLGRWMYTFKNRDTLIGLVLLGFLLPFLFLFAFLASEAVPGPFVLLALLLLFANGFSLWLVWRGWQLKLDYHQFGLCQPNLKKMLRFEQIQAMTWKFNHAQLRFESIRLPVSQEIHYVAAFTHFHPDLLTIRNFIASVIAERWWQQLSERQSVRWTKKLVFHYDELEYVPMSLFGPEEPERVAYPLTSYYLFTDHLDLFVQGKPKAVLQQSTNARNFYPGWMVLNWIYAAIQPQADPSLAVAASPFTSRPQPSTTTRDQRIQTSRDHPPGS